MSLSYDTSESMIIDEIVNFFIMGSYPIEKWCLIYTVLTFQSKWAKVQDLIFLRANFVSICHLKVVFCFLCGIIITSRKTFAQSSY